MKLRLDKAMVERGIAPTRARAQQSIASGLVAVEDEIIRKAAYPVDSCQTIELLAQTLPYVSRGGLKLATALDAWNIDVTGRICMDVGISTGGFTDCLLRRGAAQVIGIDSGHGQLAEVLRSEPRLRLVEGINARHLQPEDAVLGTSFFCMDVSFIAASLVLPAVIHAAFPPSPRNAASSREAVVLVKPQFEAGREFVGKGGIVKSRQAHHAAIERVRQTVCMHGALETRTMDSPVMGGAGNREFLLYARF